MNDRKFEIEETLLVYSEHPEIVIEKLATLRELSGYRLLPQKMITLQDTYFDTPDRKLAAKRFSLRLRKTDKTTLITLKGPPKPIPCGGQKRLEIEEIFSPKALFEIIRDLRSEGLNISYPDQNTILSPDKMNTLGFVVVQNRTTDREIRNIVSGEKEHTVLLAEMVLDSVVYHFSDLKCRHFEIEIEAKQNQDLTVIKNCIEALLENYGAELRHWKYGKLLTGMIIEKLAKKGKLEGLWAKDNKLKPAAYDKLLAYLTAKTS